MLGLQTVPSAHSRCLVKINARLTKLSMINYLFICKHGTSRQVPPSNPSLLFLLHSLINYHTLWKLSKTKLLSTNILNIGIESNPAAFTQAKVPLKQRCKFSPNMDCRMVPIQLLFPRGSQVHATKTGSIKICLHFRIIFMFCFIKWNISSQDY